MINFCFFCQILVFPGLKRPFWRFSELKNLLDTSAPPGLGAPPLPKDTAPLRIF